MTTVRSSGDTGAAFEQACERVRGLLSDLARDEMRTRHEIGTILNRMQGATQTYGEAAVERMAERIGVSPQILYQCARVAGNWSAASLSGLITRKNTRGDRLTWSHLVALTKSRSDDARRTTVGRCLEESWTVRDLAQAIAADREHERDERNAVDAETQPARVALRDGLQNASRATIQLGIILEALEERLAEHDVGDDELLDRVVTAYEKLHGTVGQTLDCLQQQGRASGRRLRVAPATTQETGARGAASGVGRRARGGAPK
jgi:hypothetical protein